MKDIICAIIGIAIFGLMGKSAYNSAKEKDMMQYKFIGIFVACIIAVLFSIFMLILSINKL